MRRVSYDRIVPPGHVPVLSAAVYVNPARRLDQAAAGLLDALQKESVSADRAQADDDARA